MNLTILAAAKAAADDSALTEVVIAALGAGGLGAIFAAIVTGLFSKRKLGAEATEIITKAAAGVVTSLERDLERQKSAREEDSRELREEMDSMAAAHVAERDEWRRVLQLHAAWDAIAIARLAEMGIDLPTVPPLMPALRHVDEQGHPLH